MSGESPPERRDTRVNRKRLDALKRRRDFLHDRVAQYVGKSASRDQAEYAALVWAIQIVEEWVEADPLLEVNLSGTPFTETATNEDIADLIGRGICLDHAQQAEVVTARVLPRKQPRTIRLLVMPLEEGQTAKRPKKRGASHV